MSTTQNNRISFGKVKHAIDYPDFLDVQLMSFQEFFQLDTPADKREGEGLFKMFRENFPITDTRNIFVIGHSAGAHMTALVSMDDSFGVREKVSGIVLLDSGNYDVVDGYNHCSGAICDV